MLQKEAIQSFYQDVWNNHNKDAIPQLLHKNISFRGSLGVEKTGHAGFIEYLDAVHASLGQYQCDIEELLSEQSKVFAKLTFSGLHKNIFLGFPPTNKKVSWQGCALFTFSGQLISRIWVLGDLKSLEIQLEKNAT